MTVQKLVRPAPAIIRRCTPGQLLSKSGLMIARQPSRIRQLGPRGFTIIEISLVIGLILSLLAIGGLLGANVVRDWRMGKDASLALQAVYAAQRSYLADHPTSDIAVADWDTDLVPYLPTGWSAATIKAIEGLDGEDLEPDTTVMPPVFLDGATPYDPSPPGDNALWDVGE